MDKDASQPNDTSAAPAPGNDTDGGGIAIQDGPQTSSLAKCLDCDWGSWKMNYGTLSNPMWLCQRCAARRIAVAADAKRRSDETTERDEQIGWLADVEKEAIRIQLASNIHDIRVLASALRNACTLAKVAIARLPNAITLVGAQSSLDTICALGRLPSATATVQQLSNEAELEQWRKDGQAVANLFDPMKSKAWPHSMRLAAETASAAHRDIRDERDAYRKYLTRLDNLDCLGDRQNPSGRDALRQFLNAIDDRYARPRGGPEFSAVKQGVSHLDFLTLPDLPTKPGKRPIGLSAQVLAENQERVDLLHRFTNAARYITRLTNGGGPKSWPFNDLADVIELLATEASLVRQLAPPIGDAPGTITTEALEGRLGILKSVGRRLEEGYEQSTIGGIDARLVQTAGEIEHAAAATSDVVNNPAHYGGKNDPYEVIKVIEAWSLGYNLGNAAKYIARAGKKDPSKEIEDLQKAFWYYARAVDNRETAKTIRHEPYSARSVAKAWKLDDALSNAVIGIACGNLDEMYYRKRDLQFAIKVRMALKDRSVQDGFLPRMPPAGRMGPFVPIRPSSESEDK